MAPAPNRLLEVLRTVVAPLIHADGGQLYLVGVDGSTVKLHLAGTCCGCPGAQHTTTEVIRPAVHAALPNLEVVVTAGWTIPAGAERIEAAED